MLRPIPLQVGGLRLVLMSPGPSTEHQVTTAPGNPGLVPMLPLAEAPHHVPDGAADHARTPDDSSRAVVLIVARTIMEVLQGRRPVLQLRSVCALEPADLVAAWSRRRDWRGTSLASVRGQLVNPEVIEGTLRLADGGRSLAASVRLEKQGDRWTCVEFGLLMTPAQQARAA